MANEVSVEVVVDTQVEAFEIFDVYKVHIDVIELIFVEKVHDFLVISGFRFI